MAKYKIIPSSRTIVRSPISIGHKAEKGVKSIEFDLTAWVETYGSGTLTVIMRRWGDAIPYPIALEIDENNKATWTLSDTDTAKAGMAYAQLNYVVGDTIVKKSDIYTFNVLDSITGEGEPPEAYESWLEHLQRLAAEAMAEVLDIESIVTDKTLSVDGGIADAKKTGDEIAALKADLGEVIEATRNLNTSNMGRWGNAADGKIYSRNDTFYGMESFVSITAGQTYYVSFGGITSASAISWTYLFVNNSGTNLERAGYSNINGHAITAPSGAKKLHIFCKSDNTITISDDAYIQIEKGSSATQHIPTMSAVDYIGRETAYIGRETADKAFQVYNVINSSTDLDTLPKNGAYRWNTSSIPQHSPAEKACRLLNIPSDANSGTGWIQIVITSDTVMYIRYRITSNWSDWVELASKAYVDTRLTELLITDGDSWEA